MRRPIFREIFSRSTECYENHDFIISAVVARKNNFPPKNRVKIGPDGYHYVPSKAWFEAKEKYDKEGFRKKHKL